MLEEVNLNCGGFYCVNAISLCLASLGNCFIISYSTKMDARGGEPKLQWFLMFESFLQQFFLSTVEKPKICTVIILELSTPHLKGIVEYALI